MTAAEFRALRQRLGMTQAQLAEALGLVPRTISSYETGAYEIPRVVELACEALLAAKGRRPLGHRGYVSSE